MSSLRKPVTCDSCRTMFVPRGRAPRCPSCGEAWQEHEALPPLPWAAQSRSRLEDPAFPKEERLDDPSAPLSEFLAAACVLGGFVMMIAGAVLTTPLVMIAGFAILGLAALVYAVSKLRSLLSGRLSDDAYHENPWNRFGPFQ